MKSNNILLRPIPWQYPHTIVNIILLSCNKIIFTINIAILNDICFIIILPMLHQILINNSHHLPIIQKPQILNPLWNTKMVLLTILLDVLWRLCKVYHLLAKIVTKFIRESSLFQSLLHNLYYAFYILAYLAHVFLPYLCFNLLVCSIFWVVFVQPYLWSATQIYPNELLIGNEWTVECLHCVKRSKSWL